jgi:hypothetical protein
VIAALAEVAALVQEYLHTLGEVIKRLDEERS